MFRKIMIGAVSLLLVAALFIGYSFFRTPESASEPVEAVALDDASEGTQTRYVLVQEASEARFLIDEVLRGDDFTVVGATNQVAGEVAFDPNNPASAEVGTITVNARALATDSAFRDRALKNRILYTDDHEYITFTPTELAGLPEAVSVGEPFSFRMTGALTITDVTRPVTFDVMVTPTKAGLEGLARSTFPYADFGLEIPASQAVQAVADEVTLELFFTASEGV